jgi:hypothetical protein
MNKNIDVTVYPEDAREGIIHLKYHSQYYLAMSFCRLQEFSESPYLNIREQFFTLEEYMDIHAENTDGHFTYDDDWVGFNITDRTIYDFIWKFAKFRRPLKKEEVLLKIIKKSVRNKFGYDIYTPKSNPSKKKFCVIGTFRNMDVDHELAHGFYYLRTKYKKEMNELYNSLTVSQRNRMHLYLKEEGYSPAEYRDETQAYFSTSTNADILGRIPKLKLPGKTKLKAFRDVFLKWKNDKRVTG